MVHQTIRKKIVMTSKELYDTEVFLESITVVAQEKKS